jgi:hypothetical protein
MFESHLIVCKPWRLKLVVLIGGTRQEIFDEFRKRKVSVKESNENAVSLSCCDTSGAYGAYFTFLRHWVRSCLNWVCHFNFSAIFFASKFT